MRDAIWEESRILIRNARACSYEISLWEFHEGRMAHAANPRGTKIADGLLRDWWAHRRVIAAILDGDALALAQEHGVSVASLTLGIQGWVIPGRGVKAP